MGVEREGDNSVHGGWLYNWNVRSTVDTVCSVEIASQRAGSHRGDDGNVDLVVNELKRYDVKVAALQETKWFGSE